MSPYLSKMKEWTSRGFLPSREFSTTDEPLSNTNTALRSARGIIQNSARSFQQKHNLEAPSQKYLAPQVLPVRSKSSTGMTIYQENYPQSQRISIYRNNSTLRQNTSNSFEQAQLYIPRSPLPTINLDERSFRLTCNTEDSYQPHTPTPDDENLIWESEVDIQIITHCPSKELGSRNYQTTPSSSEPQEMDEPINNIPMPSYDSAHSTPTSAEWEDKFVTNHNPKHETSTHANGMSTASCERKKNRRVTLTNIEHPTYGYRMRRWMFPPSERYRDIHDKRGTGGGLSQNDFDGGVENERGRSGTTRTDSRENEFLDGGTYSFSRLCGGNDGTDEFDGEHDADDEESICG